MDISDMYTKVTKAFNNDVSEVGTYTVYHYTSPEGLMGIFKDDLPKLYFSQYDSLNDTKERLDIIECLSGYCDQQVKQKKMSNELRNAIKGITLSDDFLIGRNQKEKIELENGDIIDDIVYISDEECYTYICSFSLEEDLLPMWRMYSKSEHYEGFCLGIYDNIFRNTSCHSKGYSIELRKTIYSDYEKTKLLNDLLLPICDCYDKSSENDKQTWISMIGRFIYNNQFIFKNKAFEYEKEARAILHIPKKQKEAFENISERKYRQKNGIIIPYVEFELPKESTYRINLAPTLKEDIAKDNLADFLISKGYNGIKIFPSNIPIRNC